MSKTAPNPSETVSFNGGTVRTYPANTSYQPSVFPDAEPVVTMVYTDPITRQHEEGLAVLRKPNKRRCNDEWWEGRVEFVEEPGQLYNRRIYLK